MTEPTAHRQHYNFTLAILILAGISIALQQTMVVPALPALQREFDTTTAWVTWLLTGFLLSASVATPLLGRLGDQYGKERLLLISLLIFFAGSVAAIFAPNIAVLIACRVLQGAGAAVFPLSFAIIKDEFPAEKVGVAVGAVSAVFAVGGGLGLVLSGVIMDSLSWHWLFVVGAVAVGIAATLVHLFVPESPIKSPSRVDFVGATLLSIGLVALLVALTEGESWGWGSGRVVGLFTVAAVALLAWGYAETRVPDPMVDMRMLARRPVFFANLTGLIAGFAMFGSFVLVPNFVQISEDLAGYGFGASATTTGLYLVPAAVAGFFMGPLAGILGRRWGSKWPLSLGLLLAAIALALLAEWHEEPWQVVVAMLVFGLGIPMTFAAMANIIVTAVRPTETGVATGMNTVMRTIGGVVGGQVGAAILTAETIEGVGIPQESAFTTAFWISFVAAAVGAAVALLISPLRRHAPAGEPEGVHARP
ncbi:MAG TPA: MFS transporter [Gaiellaceae bacterium]|nr:MFS transporter [Gaiellaceae bacterium]